MRTTMLSVAMLGVVLALAGCEDEDTGGACYSPTQHLDIAYEQGSQGCACDAERDQDVCVGRVALVCEDGRWSAVEDGPCEPTAPGADAGIDAGGGVSCFSPTSNVAHAYDDGAQGCACDPIKDKDVCVNKSIALVCSEGTWTAVEDGPCEPMVGDMDAGSDDAGS
jgi:hypothetical protein